MIHLKGTGCLLKENNFSAVCTCINLIYLRQYAISELWFQLDDIPLVVNWWFDDIDCISTLTNSFFAIEQVKKAGKGVKVASKKS